MRALIVDDSRAMRSILKKFLTSEGFGTLFEAADGAEALAALRQNGTVHLALVDWNMPRMNGLEFIAALRADRVYDGVRVMMVTTEAEASQVARALEAGADEYVMKPFTTEVLRGKLDLLGFAGPLDA
ncbi:MAG TPA: response regulator [Polyangiaceae bacterium]|jgi:two-component system chemotaxis response regulator CheY|nr:response regulator [Polyangiaceae bacterium]